MSRPAGSGLVLAAVLLTGLNLRGAIAAVGPVLPEVRADLGLSPTVAGLLTTLPVLCFAALAPAAAGLGRRLGAERAVLVALVALTVATALRVLDGAAVLLAGTVVVGAAMTVGNVLVPPVVKREFAARAGTVTGLHTTALVVGAATTAAVTAPVAAVWGWRIGLACWAVLGVLAVAVWAAAMRGTDARGPVADGAGGGPRVWRDGLAWAVSLLLAVQSALYYAFTAWLPTLLHDELGSGSAGAAAATTFQLVGIAGTLVVPLAVRRWAGQRALGIAVAATWAVLVVGLLAAPAAWPVWVAAGGFAQGAGVALAYTLVVLRSADEDQARRLSGMAQVVGFAVGAAGPLAVGALYAATGGWVAPLVLLLALVAGYALLAVVAGRPVVLGSRPAGAGDRT